MLQQKMLQSKLAQRMQYELKQQLHDAPCSRSDSSECTHQHSMPLRPQASTSSPVAETRQKCDCDECAWDVERSVETVPMKPRTQRSIARCCSGRHSRSDRESCLGFSSSELELQATEAQHPRRMRRLQEAPRRLEEARDVCSRWWPRWVKSPARSLDCRCRRARSQVR